MFYRSSQLRNISLNSNYIIIFFNRRDQGQILMLSRQIDGNNPRFMANVFANHINKPYKNLCISFELSDDDLLRYRSDVLSELGQEVFLTQSQFNSLQNETNECHYAPQEIFSFTKLVQ